MAPSNQTSSKLVLLEAGVRLSQEKGSAVALKVASVCSAAGLSRESFNACFTDRRAYLLALLQHYLDLARAEAIETLSLTPPGVARIQAAFQTYWTANLRWRPMRELAIHFRADPAGAEMLRVRLAGVVMIAQHELKSTGWPWPAATARLAGMMCVETAVAEFEARQELPDMRRAALAFFREPRPQISDGEVLP
jgi:AcrR family transcriptional regulator